MGDAHDGTKHFSQSEFLKVIKKIKDDPLAYFVEMGDSCEFIPPSDPRWDSGSILDWVHPDNVALNEADNYIEMVRPVANKCLGKIEGNHEKTLKKHYHIDVQDYICKALGVTNLGYSAFVRISFRRLRTDVRDIVGYFTHGSGCTITKGAKLNRLSRVMNEFSADLYAHGHVHDIITNTESYLDLNREGKIVQKVKVGAMTGCFFRTYTQGVSASYGEEKTYPPTVIGCPHFTIIPDKGFLSVEG